MIENGDYHVAGVNIDDNVEDVIVDINNNNSNHVTDFNVAITEYYDVLNFGNDYDVVNGENDGSWSV